jgi:hypothetical protein
MIMRFKYVVTHGYKIDKVIGYNLRGVARLLNGRARLEKNEIPFIPSLSFLAPSATGDVYNKNIRTRKMLITP